jgi:hypothetical protein
VGRMACQCSSMSDPFRRPPSADSLNTKIACGEDAECKYCATLRQARELELFDQLPELRATEGKRWTGWRANVPA